MTTNKDYLREAVEICKGNTKIKLNRYHIITLYREFVRLKAHTEKMAFDSNALLQDMGV